MRHLKSALAVLGAVTVLALAGNTIAVAATGQGFLLGRINSADKQSVLKRTTSGPALRLATKTSTNAPFTTNGRGKVNNLNGDLLDGLDSSALRTSVQTWNLTPPSGSVTFFHATLPLASGRYLLSYTASFSGTTAFTTCSLYTAPAGESDILTTYAHSMKEGGSFDAHLSASAVIQKTSAVDVRLTCNRPTGSLSWTSERPVQVNALRIDAGNGGQPLALD